MRALLWLLVIATALFGWRHWSTGTVPEPPTSIDLNQAMADVEGQFATVTPGRTFRFPHDHGEHPDFKTEWWYFTGNLEDGAGRAYGYQLTFFRSGLTRRDAKPAPASLPSESTGSAWATSDVMMGHLAVSDLQAGEFTSYERFSRRSQRLAGVELGEGRLPVVSVWLEDWRAERAADGRWSLQANETMPDGTPLQLELELEEVKPPVLHGEQGYSRKGPEPEHASYYVSLTRLTTKGRLQFGERESQVSGLSWFDHEWSSSLLAPGLVGWDWFSLHLDDGWDLMLFHVRHHDGRPDAASSGTLVDPQGVPTAIKLESFQLQATDHHTSPRGVRYPSAWTVEVPEHGMSLQLSPRLKNQEMTSGVPYWEGAISVRGERDGQPIHGNGFVEMTGYAP